MNIQEVEMLVSLPRVSNEKLYVTPLERNNAIMLHIISKTLRKDVFRFSRNSKYCQNHDIFEGAVMERHVNPTS